SGIAELDPANGAFLRTVATLGGSPLALAVDPLSGDLFVSRYAAIERISSYASGPGTVTGYFAGGFIDGMVFGPDGTLYFKGGCCPASIYKLAGTDKPQPAALTLVAALPDSPDGLALQPNLSDATKPFFYANRNDGTLTKVDITGVSPVLTDVFTGGGRGDFTTVGPDGCLYATQSNRIVKVTKADGTCDWGPSTVLPGLALTPALTAPNPVQGTQASFTAQLTNVSAPAGAAIFFGVTGANPSLHLRNADSSGKAIFTYVGVKPGDDVVTAAGIAGGLSLASNPGRVTWTPGKHTVFVNLSDSPGGSLANALSTLKATLTDLSLTPPAPLVGASVHFAVGAQACDAVTNASGLASCTVIPASTGGFTLTATYAGDGSHLEASDTRPYIVIGALRGDANGSGVRDVSDIFYLINALFAGGPPTANACRGDVNADGFVDVNDVFYLINYLFAGGPLPPPC
ncbi:MAG TPA: dockerin type I repeat-containing protein, partial [Thermoanaerobaculia bacterium]|nr:dockerin type I repeat-containing protein [Thermoanaerobaculia bacterium]